MRRAYVEKYNDYLLVVRHDMSEIKDGRIFYPFSTLLEYESYSTKTPGVAGLIDLFSDEDLMENYDALSSLCSEEDYVLSDWSEYGPWERERAIRGDLVTNLCYALNRIVGFDNFYSAIDLLDEIKFPYVMRRHGQNLAICFVSKKTVIEKFGGNASLGSPLIQALRACTDQVIRDHDVDVFKGNVYHPIPDLCRNASDAVISSALEDSTLNLSNPIFSFRVSDTKSNSANSLLVSRLKSWLEKDKNHFERHYAFQNVKLPQVFRDNEEVLVRSY